MKRALGSLAALGLLLALAPTLRAEPPAPPTSSSTPQRPSADPRVQRGLERLRERLRGLPSALPAPLDSAAPAGSVAPSGSAPPRATLDELSRRWAELAATRAARRERHRAELLNEAGPRATDPAVLAELKLHAARLADLARVEFLAKNARSGAEREKLLARVQKLSQKEAARHRARMSKLLAAAPLPSAVAAPSAPTPAPASSSNGAAR